MLLFPDPRPLVERLGAAFFREAPECPGVYLMRDAARSVLYVGKAKNLRKRLGSYRVANPERLRRRHLRLLRAVATIDFEACADEASALAREAELLLELRPRFNRAGTWRGPTRFFCWRSLERGLDLAVAGDIASGWRGYGPMGSGARWLRASLARLLWCALHPDRGLASLPEGWFHGRMPPEVTVPYPDGSALRLECEGGLEGFFTGEPDGLIGWLRERLREGLDGEKQRFVSAVLEAELEFLADFAEGRGFGSAFLIANC